MRFRKLSLLVGNLFFGICGGAIFGIVVAAVVLWYIGGAPGNAAIYTGMITGGILGATIGVFAAIKTSE